MKFKGFLRQIWRVSGGWPTKEVYEVWRPHGEGLGEGGVLLKKHFEFFCVENQRGNI